MTRTKDQLSPVVNKQFDTVVHLFATNDMVSLHNKRMLKELNHPIAISRATTTTSKTVVDADNKQLEKQVLLSPGQRIMLTTNIWTQTRLVNGALGKIIEIIYSSDSMPPDIPMYIMVKFDNYSGPQWHPNDPKLVPITPVSLGNLRQLPIKMAWAVTIHKAQGLTLQKATINIGATERQGLTFTVVSRVKCLEDLQIDQAFSYDWYAKMENNPYTVLRKKEEAQLQQLSR
ncbi:uncharacterized protein LOC131069158 [Cryptomeria japonica]|uniref:uncharacterized protein LOC131069158 n=1 Tax=Cryptomeria japonica TaxID=3369 RepID=UPI0025AC1AC7|nr:uncharacterized protein LOC131069158 [Cryptomeria japonica]